ncbi:hypothetical protein SYNPS1DRAFT_21317 [Syncephalis pseudoplumigaleata]|uniref:FAD/NAD(P)-binding domain-containing protein n=1 Tax=Syncephalis pseudoplumigaleata TaxID=1712513 RepID=A0A4P9Z3M5_9FUNG|nr:hypothetical protein SYNPS1DRAFT_21317 [Syncephalis pseudoplumigaleata]|eukprot:RKP27066.1 hypothetical protein SYNPS1DRAFT_21317 [Syncephalis pseudoplumigaleata]
MNPGILPMNSRLDRPPSPAHAAPSAYELTELQREIALIANAIYRERDAELAEDTAENRANLVSHETARREDHRRTMLLRAQTPAREEINPAADYINEELSEALAAGPASSTRLSALIIIIGGSFAGLAVAKELDRQAKRYNLHITLIDPRENLFCNVAFLRACLIDMGRLCFLDPDQAFTSGRVHRCRTRVLHLERDHVVLEPWSPARLKQHARNAGRSARHSSDGTLLEPPPTTLPFDFAVIAAGSQYPSPMKFSTESVEEAMREQARVRKAIQRARRILIVGGGPSGVELAAEIKHYHPGKHVTLVHYAHRLIQGELVRHKLQMRVEKTLKKMGVQLRLNERVLLTENQRMRGWIEGTRHYTTNKGEFIETDLLASAWAYESAYARVDETAKLARYKATPKFVLSLGPEDGTGQWPYIGILPSWFACRHKSKRLMLGQIYRFFNAELPSKTQTA